MFDYVQINVFFACCYAGQVWCLLKDRKLDLTALCKCEFL